jgi:hypothetical protein
LALLPTRTLIALLLVLIAASPASGQSSDPPALAVGGGAGIAFPFHSDFSSNALAWHTSIRARGAAHLLVEGLYEQWRHTTMFVTRDLTLRNAAGAPIAVVDQLRTEDATTVSYLGVNFLVTGSSGRARFSGGGGPGVLTYRGRYEVTLSRCAAMNPRNCEGSILRDSRKGLGVQAAFDVDVSLNSRIALFGRATLAIAIEDPGAGYASILAGARVIVF